MCYMNIMHKEIYLDYLSNLAYVKIVIEMLVKDMLLITITDC